MQGSQRAQQRQKNGFARDSRPARGGYGKKTMPPRPVAKSTILRSRMRFIGSVLERSDVEKHEKKSTSAFPLPIEASSLTARTTPIPLCPGGVQGGPDLTFAESVEIQWDCVYEEARTLSCPICLECPLYTAPVITHCGHVYCFPCWTQYTSHLVCEAYNNIHPVPFVPFASKVSFSQYQGDRAKPEGGSVFPPLYPSSIDLDVTCPVCAVSVSALKGVRPFSVRLLHPHELTEGNLTTDTDIVSADLGVASATPQASSASTSPKSSSSSSSPSITFQPIFRFSDFSPPSLKAILSLPADADALSKHIPNYSEDLVVPGLTRAGNSPFAPPFASRESRASKAQLHVTSKPDFAHPKNPFQKVTFDTATPYSRARKSQSAESTQVSLPQSMAVPLSLPRHLLQSFHAHNSAFSAQPTSKKGKKLESHFPVIPFRLVVLSDDPDRELTPYRSNGPATLSTLDAHAESGTSTHVTLVDPLVVPTTTCPSHSSSAAPFFLTSAYDELPVAPSESGTNLPAAYSPPTCVYAILSLLYLDKSVAEDENELYQQMNKLLMDFSETSSIRENKNMQVYARLQWKSNGNGNSQKESEKSTAKTGASSPTQFQEKDPFVLASIDRRLDFQSRLLSPFQTQSRLDALTSPPSSSSFSAAATSATKTSSTWSKPPSTAVTAAATSSPAASAPRQEDDALLAKKGGSAWSNRANTMSLRKEWHRESYSRELASKLGVDGSGIGDFSGARSPAPLSSPSSSPYGSSSTTTSTVSALTSSASFPLSIGTWRDYAAYAGLPDSRIRRIEALLSNTEELRHRRYILGWCMAKYCELWRSCVWLEHAFVKRVTLALAGIPSHSTSPNVSTISSLESALTAQSQPFRMAFSEVLSELEKIPYPPFFEEKPAPFVWMDRCSYFFPIIGGVVTYLEAMEQHLFRILRVSKNTRLLPPEAALTIRVVELLRERDQSQPPVWGKKLDVKSKDSRRSTEASARGVSADADSFGNFFEEPLKPIAQEQVRQVGNAMVRWYQTFSLFYEVVQSIAATASPRPQFSVPMQGNLMDGRHILYQSLSGERCYLHPAVVSALLENAAALGMPHPPSSSDSLTKEKQPPVWDLCHLGLPTYLLAPVHSILLVNNSFSPSDGSGGGGGDSDSMHSSRFLPMRFLPPFATVSIAFCDLDAIQVGLDITRHLTLENLDYDCTFLSCPIARSMRSAQFERDSNVLHNLWKFCFTPHKARSKRPTGTGKDSATGEPETRKPHPPPRKHSNPIATPPQASGSNQQLVAAVPSPVGGHRTRTPETSRSDRNYTPPKVKMNATDSAIRNRPNPSDPSVRNDDGSQHQSLPTPLQLLSFLDIGKAARSDAEAREILLQVGFSATDMAPIDKDQY